ncbi:hypothetical protein B296_00008592 [Ensete ventricosum]|uniref:Uncharacterized protein n=1 Tax=Ensete ventricosum TaxID=4639 RepID=A0A427APE5_ENSVE|nr:hypothetical protein B296_00008592 [Ensete ventricosum]
MGQHDQLHPPDQLVRPLRQVLPMSAAHAHPRPNTISQHRSKRHQSGHYPIAFSCTFLLHSPSTLPPRPAVSRCFLLVSSSGKLCCEPSSLTNAKRKQMYEYMRGFFISSTLFRLICSVVEKKLAGMRASKIGMLICASIDCS